ncbi:TetR/AcrR family transcriptional regulator [Neorhizobium galegae]|uniref:TetR/AcrR family transcriptional regulator n=1 Tax=Neorhizobium galegae TaxID=399 RepID=UPI00062297AF|nr:TetR/AcrR family transcriptional regulator [Neorhizobium galegae]CDZ26258.1 Transcriptional regulator, TetR family [Neorhizobium galegae bv. officinalis]KAA9385612.1 TetR/AcrR family transcriptional regulator [Neorhizobium galegae]KAB1112311.1 TetR/AcrR family transcriptional regulator [Neorhizobium galegae]MCM2499456.1 TetR family transcriptional regulator [Neorhizobium galegae]MCQ1773110.1 TetR family transcriptional regulator [Neorhizobium galegae]
MRPNLRDALLRNAVTLFSRSGYNAVSLRDIAKASGANVGSLTYHFGSKAKLLREVYERHTVPMNARRRELLGEALRIGDADQRLMAILRAYVVPAFVSSSEGDGGGAEFTRMRAVLSAEGNPDAQAIIADAFDETSRAFIKALADCVPGAPLSGLVWRSQFLLGSLYYALINPDRVTRLSGGTVDGNDREAAVDQLVEASYASFRSLRAEAGQSAAALKYATEEK